MRQQLAGRGLRNMQGRRRLGQRPGTADGLEDLDVAQAHGSNPGWKMRFYAEAGSPLPDSLFIMCRWTSLRRGDHAIADAVGGAVRRRHLPGAGLGARGAGRGARGRQSGDRQRAQRARASARPALHDRHRQPAGQRGRLPYPAGRRQRHRRHHRRATGAEPGRAAILGHRRRRLHGALRPRRRRAARGPVRAGHRDGRAGVRRVAAPARVHRRR
ncbi:Uncharacterised protein [Bordetella pertussis]|nr:Uncharacterised protein [Bordetella pertussis]